MSPQDSPRQAKSPTRDKIHPKRFKSLVGPFYALYERLRFFGKIFIEKYYTIKAEKGGGGVGEKVKRENKKRARA